MGSSMLSTLATLSALSTLAAGCQPPPHLPEPVGRPIAGDQATLQGVVLSVERPRPEDSQAYVHVLLAPAGQEPIRLVLAPRWYLDKQGIRYDANEKLTVRGQRVVEGRRSTVIARQVRQGDKSYILRDEKDRPAWLEP